MSELIGQRFGRLTVTAKTNRRDGRRVVWECRCDCGGVWYGRGDSLQRGATRSCGCLQKENQQAWVAARSTHGMSDCRMYRNWRRMRERCFNPKHERFTDYGGRGIQVCTEWDENFQAFYDYVSQLPHFGEPGYTLDRIDNDGNYEPGNVRWATALTQAHNKRNTKNKGGKA